jgi:hypothetical protein
LGRRREDPRLAAAIGKQVIRGLYVHPPPRHESLERRQKMIIRHEDNTFLGECPTFGSFIRPLSPDRFSGRSTPLSSPSSNSLEIVIVGMLLRW